MLLSLVFLTTHSKNQEIPTRIVEATFVVFPEQEIQKSNPSVSAASGHEDREYHDKANEMIVSTNRPTTVMRKIRINQEN